MPYSIRRGAGECRFEVYAIATGKTVRCHDSAREAGRHLAALRRHIPEASGVKGFGDALELLDDAEFWTRFRNRALAVVEPMFLQAAFAGVRLGLKLSAAELARQGVRPTAKGVEEDLFAELLNARVAEINNAMGQAVADYTDAWWSQWTASLQTTLKGRIVTAAEVGLQPRQIAGEFASTFGPARAMSIAVTETTRLMGLGAQATYKALGFPAWIWRTASDPRVDPICIGKANHEYPVDVPFDPAHPNCRCWPVPSGPVAPNIMAVPAAVPQAPVLPSKASVPPPPQVVAAAPADWQTWAKAELAKPGAPGPTALATKINALYPGANVKPLQVTHLKQALAKKGGLPPVVRAPKLPKGVPTGAGGFQPQMTAKGQAAAKKHMAGSGKNAEALKDDIAISLSEGLKTKPAWRTWVDERWDGDDYKAANNLIAKWAGTSGDTDAWAIAMQLAAADEFALSASARAAMLGHLNEQLGATVAQAYSRHGAAYRAFLREMYDQTQARFKAEGITRVSIMRGMGIDEARAPQWILDALPDIRNQREVRYTGKGPVGLRPMSSFSSDVRTATKFQVQLAEGNVTNGIMIEGTIPVENIVGTAQTGFGCLNEAEFVVLQTDGHLLITSTIE